MFTSVLRPLLFLPLLLLGLALAAAAPARAAANLEHTAALVQPSIAYLDISWNGVVVDPNTGARMNGGRPFTAKFSCSGFFVNPDGYIATAGHCVSYDHDVETALVDTAAEWAQNHYFTDSPSIEDARAYAEKYFTVVRPNRTRTTAAFAVAESGLPSGRTQPAAVIGARSFDDGDVALLKVFGQDFPTLKLSPTRDIAVGERIVSVGYPGSVDDVTDPSSFDPSFKDGTVSSKKTTREGLETYELSAAMSGGMSGGPTVDAGGRVIGVNSFGPAGEPEPFNFVSPASTLLQLMRDKGVANTVSRPNALYNAGIDAYFAGDRDEALKDFNGVLAELPSHPLAQQYRNRTLKLPATSSGARSTGLIAGVAAALLLVAGLGTFLMLRRRRTAAPVPQDPQGATGPNGGVQPPPIDRHPAPPSAAAALLVRDGRLAGCRFPVEGELTIGRLDADVTLDDAEVSRRHAAVRPAAGGLEVTDLQSANGTFVNGTRINGWHRLRDGDLVRLGRTAVSVELAEGQDTVLAGHMPARPSTQAGAIAAGAAAGSSSAAS